MRRRPAIVADFVGIGLAAPSATPAGAPPPRPCKAFDYRVPDG